MPIMDGLQATRLIRSFEETGNWDAAANAGIEQPLPSSDSFHPACTPTTKQIPIIAVSSSFALKLNLYNLFSLFLPISVSLHMLHSLSQNL